ncbi:hypothetical protein FB550_102401 [Neobacillus bataviensis]|uniref:Uncharacterized protein n=1 Tax=Neobacillus bataviensis TaxID=220685 RepID=A0A561DSN2_9BACI|nr:hypothetical protein [Neobacillus bataviensis]TWE06379.1 hypothetical protein FB550_102401 [Neobacillus bataviensis]
MENNSFLDMLVEEFSEALNDVGITLIPHNAELIFKLKQKFIDLKYVKGKNTVLYLNNVIDLDYYQEFIKSIKPEKEYEKDWLLLLLKDFIKGSREHGTSIEDEIREFYS